VDSNFRFLEDSAALVVPLDPAVSGEFHRIAARHLDWSPCSNGIAVADGPVHLIGEKARIPEAAAAELGARTP
jgi:hypothetical protein